MRIVARKQFFFVKLFFCCGEGLKILFILFIFSEPFFLEVHFFGGEGSKFFFFFCWQSKKCWRGSNNFFWGEVNFFCVVFSFWSKTPKNNLGWENFFIYFFFFLQVQHFLEGVIKKFGGEGAPKKRDCF